MSCETQNVDIIFNHTTAQSVRFDDTTAQALTFNDTVNENIACAKFVAPYGPESVLDEYWEVTDLDLADGAAVAPWPGRNGVDAVALASQPTYNDTNFRVEYAANQGHSIALGAAFSSTGEGVTGTFAVVTEGLTGDANDVILGFGNSASSAQFFAIAEASTGFRVWSRADNNVVYFDQTVAATVSDRNVVVVRTDGPGGTCDVWVNSTLVLDGAAFTTSFDVTLNQAALGYLPRNTNSLFMEGGGIEAAGFVSSALLDAQIDELNEYLTAVEAGAGA